MVSTQKIFLRFTFLFILLALWTTPVSAAKLLLSPSSGTFTVGSTFDVSIFLNTEGKSVNTVNAVLSFPPDKLQLVSPTIGQSVINVWTAQPVFNNQNGSIRLTGGIPGGINVQSGLITSLTFRVKQVGGSVLVKFSDESRILANDGSGTDVLTNVQSGVYNLILPPPQGPIVSSETNPDQSQWYSAKDVILRWASTSQIEGYSYMLDEDPISSPDNIVDGSRSTVAYKNIDDGTHYFHIKSLRDGVWGGVTSFGINIDSQLPANFSSQLIPSSRTSSKTQIINFQTSDALSGISRYDLRIIPVSPSSTFGEDNKELFIEATSPYQMTLPIGKYDIIVRAFDKAGNYREATDRLNVVAPLFEIVGSEGIRFFGLFVVTWLWLWIAMTILSVILLISGWRIRKWHHGVAVMHANKELPQDVKSQLETLKMYRKKYGNLVLLMVLVGSLFLGGNTYAQESQHVQLSPPLVSLVSRNISNEEIFYIGGKTTDPGVTVIIYLQNSDTGATFNQSIVSDSKGDWFYRHPTFLVAGDYLLWTQAKLDEESSPPSSQVQMTVQKTAIQLGASRLSYETVYLILAVLLLLIIAGLVCYILYHGYRGHKKHKLFRKEVKEAEESVRRGFAVLRRDIQAEFALVGKMRAERSLSEEEKIKEDQLLKDLQSMELYIGKEIWDIEENESLK